MSLTKKYKSLKREGKISELKIGHLKSSILKSKKKKNLCERWVTIWRNNLCIIGILGEKREKGVENIDTKMSEKF